MQFLNKLLSLIPGNGYKTALGLLLSVLSLGQAVLSTPDGQQLLQLIMARPVDWVAVAVLAIGILHKYVKVKAEEVK